MREAPAVVTEAVASMGARAWLRHGLLAACVTLHACDTPDSSQTFFAHADLSVDSLESISISAPPAIGRPTLLRMTGRHLWISDLASDPGLHVVDAETGVLVRSFGRMGEGPGEFSTRPFGLEIAPGDSSAVWAFDLSLQRLTRFEATSPMLDEAPAIHLRGDIRVQRVAWVTQDRLVGIANSDEARFLFFSPSGERTGEAAGALLGSPDVPRGARLAASNGGIKVCAWPGRGFAIVNFMVGRIEYYDVDANFVREPAVPYRSEPEFEPDSTGRVVFVTPRRWYFDCSATRDYLFALFSGRLQSRYEGDARSSAEYVHVFDWDGALRAVYHLDREVRAIVADDSGSLLFAASLVDGGLYRYDLPTIRRE
jgi:hypothetical protein